MLSSDRSDEAHNQIIIWPDEYIARQPTNQIVRSRVQIVIRCQTMRTPDKSENNRIREVQSSVVGEVQGSVVHQVQCGVWHECSAMQSSVL